MLSRISKCYHSTLKPGDHPSVNEKSKSFFCIICGHCCDIRPGGYAVCNLAIAISVFRIELFQYAEPFIEPVKLLITQKIIELKFRQSNVEVHAVIEFLSPFGCFRVSKPVCGAKPWSCH